MEYNLAPLEISVTVKNRFNVEWEIEWEIFLKTKAKFKVSVFYMNLT